MKGGVMNHEKKKEIFSQEKTLLEPVGFQKVLFEWTFECYAQLGRKLFLITDCNMCKFKGTINCCYYEETT